MKDYIEIIERADDSKIRALGHLRKIGYLHTQCSTEFSFDKLQQLSFLHSEGHDKWTSWIGSIVPQRLFTAASLTKLIPRK